MAKKIGEIIVELLSNIHNELKGMRHDVNDINYKIDKLDEKVKEIEHVAERYKWR